jgi:hypothetical protein
MFTVFESLAMLAGNFGSVRHIRATCAATLAVFYQTGVPSMNQTPSAPRGYQLIDGPLAGNFSACEGRQFAVVVGRPPLQTQVIYRRSQHDGQTVWRCGVEPCLSPDEPN